MEARVFGARFAPIEKRRDETTGSSRRFSFLTRIADARPKVRASSIYFFSVSGSFERI